ncbi:MAG: polymer-forming cytoskeletal protein [Candidatus Omnitrophica bacterium]|nr:polymer-forming cytoskeletal protein [Candidatus Omnitrophota bacterium]
MPKIMGRKRGIEEKVLDVDATMQGTMIFKDPVNLKINGRFDGSLTTRGILVIGDTAIVNANIEGDEITIAGNVKGNIKARSALRIIAPAKIIGDIQTPVLGISEGAIFEGRCHMEEIGDIATFSSMLSIEEVASYLEVEPSLVNEWASQGKIPARRENNSWTFEKTLIDDWILKEKVK